MGRFALKYRLDDVPPPLELVIFSLQWLAVLVPSIIIIGKVMAGFHYQSLTEQVVYVQTTFFVTALALLAQVFWGHRLPLIMGPAAVLLVGVVASAGSDPHTVYSAIMIGGLILFLVAVTGLFGHLKKLFTARVVAVVLILIAFTLAPTIMNLMVTPAVPATSFFNLIFAFVLILGMFVCERFLKGFWKSTIIIWSVIAGSLLYYLLFPGLLTREQSEIAAVAAPFASLFDFQLIVDPAVVVSFLICFAALSINDLGSVQGVGEMIQPDQMEKRINRGLSVTGLANGLSGLLGVVGPVNFSISPGIIASTGCASRYTVAPAALGLLAISFLPRITALISMIPQVVIGSVLVYVMCAQIAAGLMVALKSQKFEFVDGLIMGLPFMLGIVVSFLPGEVLATFPVCLRPLLGNGFVVGVLLVIFLDHVVYRVKT